MNIFKPMLAVDADLNKLRFPLLASAKLDGIRAIVRDGIVYSRSNKPIPNKYVQEKFGHLEHHDGELIVGDPMAHDVYRQTTSHVMAHDKTGFDVRFYVFDHIEFPNSPYEIRHRKLLSKSKDFYLHPQLEIPNLDELLITEEALLTLGYEGLILRDAVAPYKNGRSTVNEGYLLKMKRMKTDEAIIIGFAERFHNGNIATTNELGRTKRSSHQAGKSGRGDLGALLCRFNDIEFNIGTGFSDAERESIWNNQDKYLGKIASFNYFPIGVKDKPRHPVYKGLRDPIDL